MSQRSHAFSEFTNNWETFAFTEHAQKQLKRKRTQDEYWNAKKFHGSPRPRAPSMPEVFSSCLFDQSDKIFNNDILDWEDTKTRVNTTPMSSSMRYLTPAATAHTEREAEPPIFDFDFDFELFDFELFDFDSEPEFPYLEQAPVTPTPPRETPKCVPLIQQPKKYKAPMLEQATVARPLSHEQAPPLPRKQAPPLPRETAKCAPLIQKQKKCKAATTRLRCRKRPFKNIRERRRRGRINDKLAELHDVCSSDAVTSIVPRPSAAAKALIPSEASADVRRADTQKTSSKMDILRESIRLIDAMDKELIKLRARNKELKMRTRK